MKAKILKVEREEDFWEVIVEAEFEGGREKTAKFTVQLHENRFNRDCHVYCDSGGGDHDFTADENAIFDAVDVIAAAEDAADEYDETTYVLHDTDFHAAINSCSLYVREDTTDDTYMIVGVDDSHNSEYDFGKKTTEYEAFDSLEDAMDFLAPHRTNEHYDIRGLSSAFDALNFRNAEKSGWEVTA